MVEGVEEVHLELEAEPLLELPVLGELQVAVYVVRALAGAARSIANLSDAES